MVKCMECGKKLGIFEGYSHPTMGKKHHLCSPCFDHVSDSVSKWKEFVTSNAFNVNAVNNTQMDWKQIAANYSKLQKILDNLWMEKEICMKN